MNSMSLDSVNTVLIDKSDMENAIYRMIEIETEKMRTDGEYHYKDIYAEEMKLHRQSKIRKLCKEALKKIDAKLRKNNFYNLRLRGKLKKLYIRMKPSMSINMLKLFKYNDQEFVVNVYKEIFERIPEKDGLEHNLSMLQDGQISKYGFFVYLYNCNENILHKRLKWKYITRLLYRR